MPINGNICIVSIGKVRWKAKFGFAEKATYPVVENADLDHAWNDSTSKSNCFFSDSDSFVSKRLFAFKGFAQWDENYYLFIKFIRMCVSSTKMNNIIQQVQWFFYLIFHLYINEIYLIIKNSFVFVVLIIFLQNIMSIIVKILYLHMYYSFLK